MNAGKIGAIIGIYIVTALAWVALGEVTSLRSQDMYVRLGTGDRDEYDGSTSGGRSSVQKLWGSPQVQQAPEVWTSHTEKQATVDDKGKKITQEVPVNDPVVLSRSRVQADIHSDPRRKGLMWYSTYKVKFGGQYSFKNDFPNKRTFAVRFRFPEGQAAYDNVVLLVNGDRVYPGGNLADGIKTSVELDPGKTAGVSISYGSQGLDTWHYQFAENETVSSVRDFEAAIKTNCGDIDFPENCLSPTDKSPGDGGWDLNWKYGDLISGSDIGVSMPQRLQPGPFASRLSLFAPVSLFFFFAVLMILGTVKGVRLHPVHYLFLAATFFSFHLLFSYLVDHVTPFNAFLISSAVSLLLTMSYLRLVVDWKFAVFQAGVWQFVFLVLFSYAFFFEGYTGLTITIGAIVTLAVMMQLTGRVDWDKAFAKQQRPTQPTHP